MKVIGTAGHIDHGKSTLVRRLTGIDPDRLDEEKRRGMTIDLGFAWLTLPSGVEASIVDVPGHERFVKTMVAGAGGVDVALLVVAADEGIMPQTREHLDILDVLGVRYGVVALTKCDLVDEEWRELVAEEVREELVGSSLEGSSVVPVSAQSGEGLDRLLQALDSALAASPAPRDRGRPYLPIDRAFSVAGFGTVATGTLHDGTVTEGMELTLLPAGRRVKVRGLQTHRKQVDEATAGARVAVNLYGLNASDLQRGDVLAAPGAVAVTQRADVWLRVARSAPHALRHGMTVMAHVGAAEGATTLALFERAELPPGESGWGQLRFETPQAITRDEPFVLRLPAPARTVGGGIITDTAPRHRRSDRSALKRLSDLMSPNQHDRVRAAVTAASPLSIESIELRAGLTRAETSSALQELTTDGSVVRVGQRYLSKEGWDRLEREVEEALSGYHARHPLALGMAREELRTRVGWRFAGWADVLECLADRGIVRVSGARVAASGHGGGTGSRRAEADAVKELLTATPYAPPGATVLMAETGADAALLQAMVEEGEIVRVDTGLYFERAALDTVKRTAVEAIRAEGSLTVSTLRDRLGTSRKYALSLLEFLDSERVTRRIGDERVLGVQAAE